MSGDLRVTPAGGTGPLLLPACVFFVLLASVLAFSNRLLGDPDTLWHIAVGGQIWRSGDFPRVDNFSHTFAGQPWIAKEWIAQLLLAGAHAVAGWRGVTVLTALTIASSFTLLLTWLQKRLKATIAVDLLLLALLMSCAQFVARPLIFAVPLLILWTGELLRARERHSSPSLWLVPLMALWANLHASFPIAFVVAALLGLEAVVAAPPAHKWRTVAQWGCFGLAALASTGATPYGFEPLFMALKVVSANEALPYIQEWQPLKADFAGVVSILVFAGGLALMATSLRRNVFRLVMLGLLGALMIQHTRFAGMFAVIAPMVMAGPAVSRFPTLGPEATTAAPWLRRGAYGGLAAAAAATAALASLLTPTPRDQITPAAAIAAATRAGAGGAVFNDYDFGGYLVFRGIKTFVDGRTDQLFLGGFLTSLHLAVDHRDGRRVADLLDRYQIQWALLRTGSPEVETIELIGDWNKIYEDGVASAFTRRETSGLPDGQSK